MLFRSCGAGMTQPSITSGEKFVSADAIYSLVFQKVDVRLDLLQSRSALKRQPRSRSSICHRFRAMPARQNGLPFPIPRSVEKANIILED